MFSNFCNRRNNFCGCRNTNSFGTRTRWRNKSCQRPSAWHGRGSWGCFVDSMIVHYLSSEKIRRKDANFMRKRVISTWKFHYEKKSTKNDRKIFVSNLLNFPTLGNCYCKEKCSILQLFSTFWAWQIITIVPYTFKISVSMGVASDSLAAPILDPRFAVK